jgi:hypothetical protein
MLGKLAVDIAIDDRTGRIADDQLHVVLRKRGTHFQTKNQYPSN